jgi:uncharacterized protein (TIGR02246 family)
MNLRLVFAAFVGVAMAVGAIACAQDPRPAENRFQPPSADSRQAQGSTPDATAVAAATDEFVELFNSGQADRLTALFLPQAELVDDLGQVHQGADQIRELLSKYFATYPGAKLAVETESLRVAGPLAIQEGKRMITTPDAGSAEMNHFTVWARTDNGWKIASTREAPATIDPNPHQQLQPLAWLIGDWVSEESDAAISISYRWSEDNNFILGDYVMQTAGEVTLTSQQRIGWNPVAGQFRSWIFDSDGGFSEADWTQTDDAWVIKSAAVLPDGATGSVTLTLTPIDNNRYSIQGTDRVLGSTRDNDFVLTVTRKPPLPNKP